MRGSTDTDAHSNKDTNTTAERGHVRNWRAVRIDQLREQHVLQFRVVPDRSTLRRLQLARHLPAAEGHRRPVRQRHRLHQWQLRSELGNLSSTQDSNADSNANPEATWGFVQQCQPMSGWVFL